uniref:Uncharacterized protein n=1 Tax=Zea mays TaxID=4577 RepID=A0A804PN45_MAIZE
MPKPQLKICAWAYPSIHAPRGGSPLPRLSLSLLPGSRLPLLPHRVAAPSLSPHAEARIRRQIPTLRVFLWISFFLAASLLLWAFDPGLGSWEGEVWWAAAGDLAGRIWPAGRSRSRSGSGSSTARTSGPPSTIPPPRSPRSRSSSSLGGRKIRI